tara:strand:- start:306 stop:572 length:267 start_codon:yes stop_codon:yes gene_type:complete
MKLFYIKMAERSKFDSFTAHHLLDVTDTYLHAQELKKYYESDSHKTLDRITIQYSYPNNLTTEPTITDFNKDRMLKFLNLGPITKEAA